MNPVNDLSTERNIEKLLVNGLLFCGLRGNESIVDKLKNLEEQLTKGADVNAPDANDSNNTSLHVAVQKDEPEIVKFLLQKGANVNAKNKNNQSPKDLAIISNKPNKREIISILLTAINFNEGKNTNETKSVEKELPKITSKVTKVIKHKETLLTCKKQSGTSGIGGQLYETKLIGLLLFRAINDQDIVEFYLGSNVKECGILDDIVFKYSLKNEKNPKIVFIQTKHRDTNTEKNRLTVNSVLKSNDNFSLDKYFMSYIKIQKKIQQQNNTDAMFQKGEHISDFSYIIYTPIEEQFEKKKCVPFHSKEKIISTGDRGKIFAYNYDENDVNALLKKYLMLQAKALAQAFAKNIAKGKYATIFRDELIKKYHVYLTKNVIEICKENAKDYLKARFRKSFLENKDEIFMMMKKIMFIELKKHGELSTLEFKLPINFGNIKVSLNEEEYTELDKVIGKLLVLAENTDNKSTIVVDDDMVKMKKIILKKRDIALIGKLVGETLVFDSKSGFLKLNIEEPLSEITKRVLENLKLYIAADSDIKKIKFHITVQNFPQLSLCNMKLKNMLTNFLDNFKFYTGQEKEEGVENILKYEINDRYITENEKNDVFYRIKGDAIYLQFHDRIQKWWKDPKEYLTKTCNYYEESKKVIEDSPLVNINSYVYIKKMNKYSINFDQKATIFLKLQSFMSNPIQNILHLITKDKTWTSIKVIQYFKDIQKLQYCKFIDFDVVTAEGYHEIIATEISETQMDVTVIVISDASYLKKNFFQVLEKIKKLIVISDFNSLLKEDFKSIEHFDQSNSFYDLDYKSKQKINQEKYILFQGLEDSFNSIVDVNLQHLVKDKVLHQLMENNSIKIGKELTDVKKYYENKEYYVRRCLCRCLYFRKKEYLSFFNVIECDDIRKDGIIGEIFKNKDVILISKFETAFTDICKTVNNIVHWFSRKDDKIKWVKSNGSIQNLYPYLYFKCDENDTCYFLQPQTLRDINDRVVIISGEPGMGKSTLLTHLMMETKHLDKSMCIIKLNLLYLTNEFSVWKDYNAGKRLNWFLEILYAAFSNYRTDFLKTANEKFIDALNVISLDSDNRAFLISEEATKETCEITLFEFNVFLNMYNKGEITLILDGFDEICPDYKKEAMELFEVLVKSRLQRLWITSRCYAVLKELELELKTYAYKLKRFSPNDQINYLESFWRGNSIQPFDYSAVIFLNFISRKIDYEGDFTATPLHLHMIAETYEEFFSSISFTNSPKFNDTFNLITLYDKFIDIKFYKIRFGEKRKCLCYKDPDIKTVIELARNYFIENHKILAAYALFDRNPDTGVLTEEDLKRVFDLKERFNLGEEKTGIIGTIYQNEPKFVHFTYAEYFACEFLCDRLKQNNEPTWKYMINHILINDKRGLRRFFNEKLRNDNTLFNLTSKLVHDYLLLQTLDNTLDGSALICAQYENHSNITLFLFNNLDTFSNEDNLDDFLALVSNPKLSIWLHSYDVKNNLKDVEVMAKIIKVITRLDSAKLIKLFFNNDDIPIHNLFQLVFLHQYPMSDIEISGVAIDNITSMIELMSPEHITKLLTTQFYGSTHTFTILHIALQEYHLSTEKYILKYIEKLSPEQRLRVLSARDSSGRVPAHKAAERLKFDFFDKMETLVGEEDFKTLCTLGDNSHVTPLRYFLSPYSYRQLCNENIDKFTLLCAKAGVQVHFDY